MAATTDAQDAARATANEAWSSMSRMISGMIVYGGLGWAVGTWLGAGVAGLAIGAMSGLALGLYLSVVSLRRLDATPALQVSSGRSWSARMTRARIERAKEEEVDHGA